MQKYIFYAVWAAAALIMLIFYSKREHAFRSSLLGMGSGAGGLLILHYFGSYIGIAVPLNIFNTALSLILGIPGTALIAVVNKYPDII